jgi:outer membrane protein assembly factor BamB
MNTFRLLATAIALSFVISGFSLLAQNTDQSKDWSIVASYEITGKASGLAWDGQFLYFGIYGSNGDKVYRFDPSTGEETLLFSNPEIGDSYGMTYDGEYLWIIDQPSGSSNPALAKQLDFSGTILQTVALPDHYMSGIAWDNGDFWALTYYPDPGNVYKVDDEGTVLNSFVPPDDQPWDAALQDEFLWIVDYWEYTICKVDTTDGQVIECHMSENQRPSGIVYDGQFLWYVDGPIGGSSTLYKVDLGGSGTPQINLPYTTWDFGNVAVGDSAVWSMNIGNTGTAPLEVENLQVPGAAPIFSWQTFPITIEPGESVNVDIIFKPSAPGPLNTVFQVLSDDPINPSVDVTVVGEGVLVGPSIVIPVTSYDFGGVRIGAHTRWFMNVKNIGNDVLSVTSIVSDEAAFFVEPDLTFPIELAPLEEFDFGIWFNPTTDDDYSGTLAVASNDPDNPVVNVGVEGSGIDQTYAIGDELWYFNITTGWDNSPKAIGSIRDITGDGIDDVIVCSEDNFIRCFNGNSHGLADIIWEFEIYSGNVYQQQALSFHNDIDGDGYMDVVVGTTGGDRSVTAISGKTGQQLWKFNTSLWGSGGWVYAVDAYRDFNGDGVADPLGVAGNDATGTGPRRAFCIDGTDGSLIWDYFFGGPGFGVISIADVNSDGVPDVLAGASNASETEGRVVCINGATGNAIWSKTTGGSSVWGLVQIGDVSGDGIPDVAAGDFGGNYYGYDAANGDILFSGGLGSSIITRMFMLDDVNADGFPDILFGSSSSNCVVVSGYDGNNIWLKPVAQLAWNVARINDVNGDGINDVVVGTLFQNNFVYYLDGTTGDELHSLNFYEAVDAINTIPDITGDESMEVVAGGREGKVVCYSGGIDTWTSVPQPSKSGNMLKIDASPNPFSDNVNITVESNLDLDIAINIITTGGLTIRHFGSRALADGPIHVNWDGTNMAGANVNPGLYFVVITSGQYQKTFKLIKK